MTIEPWICDRCGKENPYVNTNTVTDWLERECWQGHVYHLCPECHLALDDGDGESFGCPICQEKENERLQ